MNKFIYIPLFLILITGVTWWQFSKKSSTTDISTNTIIVGTNPHFPPFEFMENDELKGFDIDLMNQIAQQLGKKIEWKAMTFDSLIPGIQMGSIQVIAAGMTPTPERAQQILFTDKYLTGNPLAIITLANNQSITTLKDLNNKTVVVNEGYTADFYMSKIEGPQLLRLETALDAFMALGANRADAFVAAKNSVKPFLDKYGYDKYKIIPIEGTDESSALGISKKHPQLLDAIQKALNTLQENGTLEELKKKWGLEFDWDNK